FPRRLIEERRITYVKVGRHVRIPESAVREFIDANTVQPRRRGRALRGVAA
ncbi:excisionase family DNA-binding protein, partial [Streptomyces sp. NPDC004365]